MLNYKLDINNKIKGKSTMARPVTNTIAYFSHDTDMSEDDKIEKLEYKYGLAGYAIYNKILREKERNAISKLLMHYKTQNPDKNTLETLVDFENIFRQSFTADSNNMQ